MFPWGKGAGPNWETNLRLSDGSGGYMGVLGGNCKEGYPGPVTRCHRHRAFGLSAGARLQRGTSIRAVVTGIGFRIIWPFMAPSPAFGSVGLFRMAVTASMPSTTRPKTA